MSKKPAQPQDKYVLRLPDGMRDRLKLAADSRHRSMNAEIIARLEGSFRGWPKITLSEELFDRVKNSGFDQRKAMEKEIETFTVKVVERELPASHELRRDFMEAFYRLLRPVQGDVSTELQERFRALAEDVEKAARQSESSE